MKVREFIKGEYDMDVYNDVTDDWAICACCPINLTEAGEKKFAEVLEYEVEVIEDPYYGPHAVVCVDGDNWNRCLTKVMEFFDSAAGYCTTEEWDEWFKEK